MFTKTVDAQARMAIAESAKLERQEAPRKEAERAQEIADSLEVERQKNIKALRP
jgi:hypothetical protein